MPKASAGRPRDAAATANGQETCSYAPSKRPAFIRHNLREGCWCPIGRSTSLRSPVPSVVTPAKGEARELGPCRQRARTDRWFPARLRGRDDSFLCCAVCAFAPSVILGRAAQAQRAEAAKFRSSRSEMPKARLGPRRRRGDLSLLGRPHHRHSLRDGVKGASSTCNSGGTHRLSVTGFLYGKAGFI